MSGDLISSLNKNGSGLDLQGLATSLVQAEIKPRLDAQEARVESADVSISALAKVKAQFSKLQTALQDLRAEPILDVSSSDPALTATVTDRALLTETTTQIDVLQTAQPQVLEFKGFTALDQAVGVGTLTIEHGVWSDDAAGAPTLFTADPDETPATLNLASGATLSDLSEALNALEGVSARVLDKGDGTYSLAVASEPGSANGLRFTAAPVVGGEALSDFDTTATNTDRQIQAALDAVMLVDGVAVFRPTNTVDDVVPGLSLELSGPVTTGRLSVGRSEETARSNMEGLVAALNETKALLAEMTARGLDGQAAGDLAGDPFVRQLSDRIADLVAEPIAGFGEDGIHLAELGVATRRDGTFRLDETAFERAWETRPADFDAVFSNSLRSSTPGLEVAGLPGSDLAPGAYSFVRGAQTATLGGQELLGVDLGDGRQAFTAISGTAVGLSLTAEAGVTDGSVRFGRSFINKLDMLLEKAMGDGGAIARSEAQAGRLSADAEDRIAELEARSAVLEKRYTSRFAEMEKNITRMKNTGDYLTNLVKAWNKSD